MSLSEFIMPIVQPLGLVWGALVLFAFLNYFQKRRAQGAILGTLAVMLSILDCSPLSGLLLGTLERPYLAKNVATAQACDAVVLLGGGSFVSLQENHHLGFGEFSGRLITAAEAMRQNKGRALAIGGNKAKLDGADELESQGVREWLESWKLFDAPIVALGECHNTHDEALASARLAGSSHWKKIALVTSAWHMRRAEGVFRAAGLEVEPIPADFKSRGVPYRFRTIVPSGDGLRYLNCYLHEEIGWIVYRWRGWIAT